MVNKPKANGTSAESMVREYCKENGWPYAKRLSLSGNKDVGDIDLHPRLTIEVKATQGRPLIGPWMNETYVEQLRAGADFGILVIKYQGVGARTTGKFLTVMRLGEAERLIMRVPASQARVRQERHGIKQEPVRLLRLMDLDNHGTEKSSIIHKARGGTLDHEDYHFMWLEDRLALLKVAGYGETRHIDTERSTDE